MDVIEQALGVAPLAQAYCKCSSHMRNKSVGILISCRTRFCSQSFWKSVNQNTCSNHNVGKTKIFVRRSKVWKEPYDLTFQFSRLPFSSLSLISCLDNKSSFVRARLTRVLQISGPTGVFCAGPWGWLPGWCYKISYSPKHFVLRFYQFGVHTTTKQAPVTLDAVQLSVTLASGIDDSVTFPPSRYQWSLLTSFPRFPELQGMIGGDDIIQIKRCRSWIWRNFQHFWSPDYFRRQSTPSQAVHGNLPRNLTPKHSQHSGIQWGP